MNPVRVKICGIRTLDEALASVESGADALGFNFWPRSPRYISPVEAGKIVERLPKAVATVGVFVNEEARRVSNIVDSAGLSAVQLHGDESPGYCAELRDLRIIKAFRVGCGFTPDLIKQYPVDSVLLDTSVKGSYGGTGKAFDWSVAVEAKQFCQVILAGGITIENVARAIIDVTPAAIDVCSGVEAEPGRKDLDKLRLLLAAVADANRLVTSKIDNCNSKGRNVSPF